MIYCYGNVTIIILFYFIFLNPVHNSQEMKKYAMQYKNPHESYALQCFSVESMVVDGTK